MEEKEKQKRRKAERERGSFGNNSGRKRNRNNNSRKGDISGAQSQRGTGYGEPTYRTTRQDVAQETEGN